jgi:hypothetical protein
MFAGSAATSVGFLHRDVLGRDLGRIEQIMPARRPTRLPVVLTRAEVREVQGGGALVRDRQAGHVSLVAPLVRHPPTGGRLRHPHGAGATGKAARGRPPYAASQTGFPGPWTKLHQGSTLDGEGGSVPIGWSMANVLCGVGCGVERGEYQLK